MKKIFEIPEIEVVDLLVADVITTSDDIDTGTPGNNETGIW